MERKLYQGREWMLEDPEFMLRLEDFIHGFPIAIFLIGILIYKCTREPVDDGIDDLEPNEPVDPPTPVRTPSSTENASQPAPSRALRGERAPPSVHHAATAAGPCKRCGEAVAHQGFHTSMCMLPESIWSPRLPGL